MSGHGEVGDYGDEEGRDDESDVGGEDGVLACPSHDGGDSFYEQTLVLDAAELKKVFLRVNQVVHEQFVLADQ